MACVGIIRHLVDDVKTTVAGESEQCDAALRSSINIRMDIAESKEIDQALERAGKRERSQTDRRKKRGRVLGRKTRSEVGGLGNLSEQRSTKKSIRAVIYLSSRHSL
jgi:hypothetical protein